MPTAKGTVWHAAYVPILHLLTFRWHQWAFSQKCLEAQQLWDQFNKLGGQQEWRKELYSKKQTNKKKPQNKTPLLLTAAPKQWERYLFDIEGKKEVFYTVNQHGEGQGVEARLKSLMDTQSWLIPTKSAVLVWWLSLCTWEPRYPNAIFSL